MPSRTSILSLLIAALFVVTGCSDDDEGPVAGNNDCLPTGNGSPPAITMVEWTQAPGCAPGTPSSVTIVVSVSDSDTAPGDITYVGSVTSCAGDISSALSVISCPQGGQYAGEVRVTDPQGNCDRVAFTFGPCEDGQIIP